MSSFSELFKDVSTRLVRSMVLAKAFAQQSESGDSPCTSAGGLQLDECSFADLCRKITPDILQPCLSKLLESLYDLLESYHSMLAWHEAGLAEHTQAAAAAAAAAAHAAARSSGHSEGGGTAAANQEAPEADVVPSQEQLDQVQAATKGILQGVQAALQAKRMATAEAAAVLVKDLMAGAGGCSGSDFPQVCMSHVKESLRHQVTMCKMNQAQATSQLSSNAWGQMANRLTGERRQLSACRLCRWF